MKKYPSQCFMLYFFWTVVLCSVTVRCSKGANFSLSSSQLNRYSRGYYNTSLPHMHAWQAGIPNVKRKNCWTMQPGVEQGPSKTLTRKKMDHVAQWLISLILVQRVSGSVQFLVEPKKSFPFPSMFAPFVGQTHR